MADPKVFERIYLSPPHMGTQERILLEDAFSSNWIAPLGPHVTEFENEVAAYAKCKAAVALSSGTAAIHLALRLLNVSRGDNVFCSSLTFVAGANPILYEGATPVFIDSEPESWNLSPAALERAMFNYEAEGRLPKALILADIYGQCADIDRIKPICDKYSVPIIEDAAESLGALYKGLPAGSMGEFGIFSFNGNKIITTSGGGMLVSNNIAAIEKARFFSTQSRDIAPHYQHSELGYNYRMSNLLAAVGRGQLQSLDERVNRRREVFGRYLEAFGKFEEVQFMPEPSYSRSTRWLTTMILDPKKTHVKPMKIINALAQANIEARPIWKPLHLQPLFEGMRYFPHEKNRSFIDEVFENGLCLPSGSSLEPSAQMRVIKIIMDMLSQK